MAEKNTSRKPAPKKKTPAKTPAKATASSKPAPKRATAAKSPAKPKKPTVNKVNKENAARIERRNREIAGVVSISLGIFCALTLTAPTGDAGAKISSVGFGMFGFVYYLLSIIFISYGIFTIVMASKNNHFAKSMLVLMILLCVMSMFHLEYAEQLALNSTYLKYLQKSFDFSLVRKAGGGVFGALFSLPLRLLIGKSASYLFFATLLLIEAIILTNLSLKQAGTTVSRVIMDNLDSIQRWQAEKRELREQDDYDYIDEESGYDGEYFEDEHYNYYDDQPQGRQYRQDLNFDQSKESPTRRDMEPDFEEQTFRSEASRENRENRENNENREKIARPKPRKKRNPFDFPDFTEAEADVSGAIHKANWEAKVRPIEAMPSNEGRSLHEKYDWEGYDDDKTELDDPMVVDRWYDVREDFPDNLRSQLDGNSGYSAASGKDIYTFKVDDVDGIEETAEGKKNDGLRYFEKSNIGKSGSAGDDRDGSQKNRYDYDQKHEAFLPKVPRKAKPAVPQFLDGFAENKALEYDSERYSDGEGRIGDQEPNSGKTSTPDHEEGASVWPNPRDVSAERIAERERKQEDADKRLSRSQEIQAKRDRKETKPTKREQKPYAPPPLKCLSYPDKRIAGRENPRLKAKKLEETLASFGVQAEVIDISQGPVITRFELRPAPGVRVNRIANLSDDLALNLAAKTVRIEAPIPGKAAIGIEIPNANISAVTLRELIESNEFKSQKSKLSVALGRDIAGKIIIADIAKMPHLLIAGSTGAGKSVCINTIVCSFLYHARPEEVKLILIDPKVVELASFNLIPHLLIPVVTDPKKAASALNWAVHEMVERYNSFAEHGARDLARYNKIMQELGEEPLPQIVAVIDELADLMMVAPDDVEDAICRIAQMGRAAGIHLIVATQRPSSDIITGLIKANIPSRIAFAVASGTDSRIILDRTGAEKLLGKGDMLFQPIGASKAIRVQGALVTDTEIESIKEHFQTMYGPKPAQFDQQIIEDIDSGQLLESKGKGKKSDNSSASGNDGEYDELLPQAAETLMQLGHASISMVQRRHRIGYNRAARIVDEMEQMGIVSAADGSKPRNVLIDRAGFERIFGYPPSIPPIGS